MLEERIQPAAVVVHGVDDVVRACAPGLRLTLLSAPGAALFAGPGWWLALVSRARARFPDQISADLLDCGDAAGMALAAMRLGQRTLILDPACPAFASVVAAAAGYEARVSPLRPVALDMAARGAERRLAAWLGDRIPPLR